MPYRRIFVIIFAVIALVCFSPAILLAESVTLSDLGVDNTDGDVTVGFRIQINDMAPLMEALKNGGDYEVRCSGKLFKRRAGFWNSLLTEAEYACLLSSKPISRECRLEDYRGVHTFSFHEAEKELRKIWSRVSFPMGKWDMIERNNLYRVVLTFRIIRTNISAWVSRPLFFVNWDLVPEVEYVVDFDY